MCHPKTRTQRLSLDMPPQGVSPQAAAAGMGEHGAELLTSCFGPAIRNREQRAILSIRLGHGHRHPGLFVPMQGAREESRPPAPPSPVGTPERNEEKKRI